MDVNSFVIGYTKGKQSASGGGSGGGVELNIAYGDTPPEDTSKLWVKTSEPSGVVAAYGDTGRKEGIESFGQANGYYNQSAYAAIGTKIYWFGGGTSSTSYNTIYWLDTETQTKGTCAATLPSACMTMGFCTVGTKVYLFGGRDKSNASSFTSYNTIYVFDGETETVTTLTATLPKDLAAVGCCYDEQYYPSYIYLFGGLSSSSVKVSTIYMFDMETETFTTRAGLPYTVWGATCISIDGAMLVCGGASTTHGQDVVWYSPKTNSISATFTKKLPRAIVGAGCAKAPDGSYYFFGGASGLGSGSTYSDIIRLWLKDGLLYTETLETALPSKGTSAWAVCIGDYMYVGCSSDVNQFAWKIESFNVANGTIQIFQHATKNIFPIINTDNVRVEIGVEVVCKGNENNEGEKAEAALYKDGAWVTI